MIFDKGFKGIIKGYSKTIESSKGKLTQQIKDKIDAGDKKTIEDILKERRREILQEANRESDTAKKQEINSQADSVQEVIDNLNEILNA